MAIKNTISNLGSAIINLVTNKIANRDKKVEDALLELKSMIDDFIDKS